MGASIVIAVRFFCNVNVKKIVRVERVLERGLPKRAGGLPQGTKRHTTKCPVLPRCSSS